MNKYLFIILATFLTFTISNITFSEELKLEKKIIGTWIVDKPLEDCCKNTGIYTETTFFKDHEFNVDGSLLVNGQKIKFHVEGKWEIKGNTIFSKVTKSTNQKLLPVNTIIKDTILNITNDTMEYLEENKKLIATRSVVKNKEYIEAKKKREKIRKRLSDGKCYGDGDGKAYTAGLFSTYKYGIDKNGKPKVGPSYGIGIFISTTTSPIVATGHISSSVSNTSCYDFWENGHPELVTFIHKEKKILQEELGQGGGDHLEALLTLRGCHYNIHTKISSEIRSKYEIIYNDQIPDLNKEWLLLMTLNQVIDQNSLFRECNEKLFEWM